MLSEDVEAVCLPLGQEAVEGDEEDHALPELILPDVHEQRELEH